MQDIKPSLNSPELMIAQTAQTLNIIKTLNTTLIIKTGSINPNIRTINIISRSISSIKIHNTAIRPRHSRSMQILKTSCQTQKYSE